MRLLTWNLWGEQGPYAERAERIEQMVREQAPEVAPERRGDGDYMFTTDWGEPVHPGTLSSLFPILIKRFNQAHPNAPRARLNDLRHIHATMLLLAGVPAHVVAARLGHADPSITLRDDAHVIRAAQALAAGVFAQAIDE